MFNILGNTVKNNEFINGKDFWISYNPMTDTGLSETALCSKKKGRAGFLILNGDKRDEFRSLVPKGYKACKDKFKELVVKEEAEMSFWSEELK